MLEDLLPTSSSTRVLALVGKRTSNKSVLFYQLAQIQVYLR